LNAINQLNSAYKSGDAWVRIASSVQAWVVVHWEDPQLLEPIRNLAHLIPINASPAEDCTLEAMRTQACANQCMDFKGHYLHSLRLTERYTEADFRVSITSLPCFSAANALCSQPKNYSANLSL
jgi:hypothetical protein